MRLSLPAAARSALAALVLSAAACTERPTALKPHGAARVLLRATLPAAGERVDVAVYYLRAPNDARVPLTEAHFPVTGAGTQQFALDVDTLQQPVDHFFVLDVELLVADDVIEHLLEPILNHLVVRLRERLLPVL